MHVTHRRRRRRRHRGGRRRPLSFRRVPSRRVSSRRACPAQGPQRGVPANERHRRSASASSPTPACAVSAHGPFAHHAPLTIHVVRRAARRGQGWGGRRQPAARRSQTRRCPPPTRRGTTTGIALVLLLDARCRYYRIGCSMLDARCPRGMRRTPAPGAHYPHCITGIRDLALIGRDPAPSQCAVPRHSALPAAGAATSNKQQ